MGRGSLNFEILRGGELKQFCKFRCRGGGSKNRALRQGGLGFFLE